ncbi:MAG: GYD domain-containing protein [Thermoflexus sp.]|jgi:uncharacterized protein with GYD domain|uniref:GYD domain-containing protein n=1 Tax=Thermoflexus sp. TaxID=1969742 RepID=UPI0028CD2899|nr:GYD domain-containing protein [Thermoflexus sp.]
MTLYAILTRLSPEALARPGAIQELGAKVSEALQAQVPEARWVASYAVLGPCDYLDIIEAPNEEVAARASAVIRTLGHATTETWVLIPWERFKAIAP